MLRRAMQAMGVVAAVRQAQKLDKIEEARGSVG